MSAKPATLDAIADTSDLEQCGPRMHVYIPLHISGDGVTRAITRTAATATKSAAKRNDSSTAVDDEGGDKSQKTVQQKQQQEGEADNGAASAKKNAHLASIPENFPVDANCSLAALRQQLEKMTRSKIFLGFIDHITGGLIELREDTLRQFSSVPDQRKAIHCRLLKRQQSKSEKILLEVEKRKKMEAKAQTQATSTRCAIPPSSSSLSRQEQQQQKQHEDPAVEGAAADPRWEAKRRQAELLERLCEFDRKRREINRTKLEKSMYPSEDDDRGGRSTPAPVSSSSGSGSGAAAVRAARSTTAAAATPQPTSATEHHQENSVARRIKPQREIDEYIARLGASQAERKEQLREKARNDMIESGYIVEPVRKTTMETEEERCNRFYGHGVSWQQKHHEKVAKQQGEQAKRNVPKLRKKEEWDEWMARRTKPLVERDKLAELNKPIVRVVGSLWRGPRSEDDTTEDS